MNKVPLSTYRLQFRPEFTFHDAAELAAYLAQLGVSHLYASPYLQAAAGSTHGYDVVDPGRVSAELGGAEGHARLCRALQEHGLGQVLDVVPNHMAIASPANRWWWDVLQSGAASPYAAYFDLDWKPPEERLRGKIFLPVLGDHYGRVLERGEIRLEQVEGAVRVRYFDHLFPASPWSLGRLLERAAAACACEALSFLAAAFQCLLPPWPAGTENRERRQGNKAHLMRRLARVLAQNPEAAGALTEAIREYNASADLLDAFLGEQNYRLAFWRAGSRDLGYRRFFSIDSLAALRMEDEQVFADTHRLVLEWLAQGVLDGLRVDHPDGLAAPAAYFRRLRAAAPEAWIVAEKILDPREALPADWPVDGTTGYDFLNTVDGLFIDPSAEGPLTRFYREFTGAETDWAEVSREKKHQVLQTLFGSDINRLTELAVRICERRRRYRDFTRFDLNAALREIIACFPVYRSYVDPRSGKISETDREFITQALAAATKNRCELDPDLFDFIKDLLLLELTGGPEAEFVVRFQQTSGPAAAKGIEDTAFYNYNRFVALNEVGGDPARFGLSAAAFHRAMLGRAADRPHAMLATSTHDTKRSEDVRARLALLTEIPRRWCEAVGRWSGCLERHCRGRAPGRNMQYFLYQNLFGAWPIAKERVLAFVEKAAREAKAETSWMRIDAGYETDLAAFVEAMYAAPEFMADLEAFTAPLVAAGRINSLSLALIKLTAPGVPDLYQGTELWDLSLVDPDNRRPVDFRLRRRRLNELQKLSPEETLARMDEGLPKLRLIQRALHLRRERADLFREANYSPLTAAGAKSEHVVAFARAGAVVCVAPRLVLGLAGDWGDTRLALPPGSWRNVLTDERIEAAEVGLQRLTARFPLALLARE